MPRNLAGSEDLPQSLTETEDMPQRLAEPEEMPRNLVGSNAQNLVGAVMQKEEPSDEELLAANMPSEPITLRWRYTNKSIQLYERHLRSLREYGIGSPLQAWVRSRLEWVADNKLSEKPNGVIVIDVDPKGDVDINLQDQGFPPEFCEEDLVWKGDALAGCKIAGSLWLAQDGTIFHMPKKLKGACETFTRDLIKTFGYQFRCLQFSKSELSNVEVFVINDEFGIIPCLGHGGNVTTKLQECFEKLWSK